MLNNILISGVCFLVGGVLLLVFSESLSKSKYMKKIKIKNPQKAIVSSVGYALSVAGLVFILKSLF